MNEYSKKSFETGVTSFISLTLRFILSYLRPSYVLYFARKEVWSNWYVDISFGCYRNIMIEFSNK